MKKNIREVSICHQVLRRQGGMEHYAIALARAFRELDLRVVYYARTADMDLASELGLEIRLSGQRNTLRKLRDWQFKRFIERAGKSMTGLQIALSRVPVRHLAVCGGTHLGYLRAARKVRGPFDRLQISMERRAYESVRFVVSHSDLCTAELRELYKIPPGKIKTLYPPLDGVFSSGDQLSSRRALGLPSGKPVLLFPSMGHGRKGLRRVCAALAELDEDVILAVAGKPGDTSRWPFVRSLGYVDRMEVAYRAADFTVLGSVYEPFGLVGPESVLCGTRLVFDESIGCLRAIDQRAATVFNVRDKASVKRAVLEALNLRRENAHRLQNPARYLRYDPDPLEHARELLKLGERAMKT